MFWIDLGCDFGGLGGVGGGGQFGAVWGLIIFKKKKTETSFFQRCCFAWGNGYFWDMFEARRGSKLGPKGVREGSGKQLVTALIFASIFDQFWIPCGAQTGQNSGTKSRGAILEGLKNRCF